MRLLGSLGIATLASLTMLNMDAGANELIQLLNTNQCPKCMLDHADLTQSHLQGTNLKGAQLRSANLSGAMLDDADLSDTDLSFSSLNGASLRRANLTGAKLYGSDIRGADLTGAKFDLLSLEEAHWSGARGVNSDWLSYSALYGAGQLSFDNKRYLEAEQWFSLAIERIPSAAISWMARGFVRLESGKSELAKQDFVYASNLYKQSGEKNVSSQLSNLIKQIDATEIPVKGGNGAGIKILGGVMSAFKAIAPLALKVFSNGSI